MKRAISLLTFTAVVFRSEVALFLFVAMLAPLATGRISFYSVVKTGVWSGILSIGTLSIFSILFLSNRVSIALTVAVDSYFWGRFPVWPEFEAFWFNVYEGKSSDWGVGIILSVPSSTKLILI